MKDFDVTGEITVRIAAHGAMGASSKFKEWHPGSIVTNVEEVKPKPLDRDELVRMVRMLKWSLKTNQSTTIAANLLLERFLATEGE